MPLFSLKLFLIRPGAVKQPVNTNKTNNTPELSSTRRKSVNGTPVTVIVVQQPQLVPLQLIMARLAPGEAPPNGMLAALAQPVVPFIRINNSSNITEKEAMEEGEGANDTKTIGKNIMLMGGEEVVPAISRITTTSNT